MSEVETQLRARDKTITVLMDRVASMLAHQSSSFALLDQNATLERIVAHRTREIEDQRRELERTVDELKRTQAELMQANKLTAIGQLAAGVAHEINTPIQYVTDNTAFLESAFGSLMQVMDAVGPLLDARSLAEVPAATVDHARAVARRAKLPFLGKQVPRAIEQAQEGLSRVTTIVAAMKEFSHPSYGHKMAVDLREALQSTITVACNEWKYVAELELDVSPELNRVPCLRDEMNQVFLNLVVNAAHAIGDAVGETGTKGTIRIVGRRVGDWAEIRVSDTGTGIPPHVQPRVFEPFFTTKGVGKGTGQGLAIAYSVVVDKHQGSIELETAVGQGTTFIIHIPMEADGADGVAP